MFAQPREAILHPIFIDKASKVVPDRRREFGLVVEEACGVVGLKPARGAVEGAGDDASRQGLAFEGGHAAPEIGCCGRARACQPNQDQKSE